MSRKDTEMNVKWYASGGGIRRGGPYNTQVEAWESMHWNEKFSKIHRSIHPSDTKVWPELIGVVSDARD